MRTFKGDFDCGCCNDSEDAHDIFDNLFWAVNDDWFVDFALSFRMLVCCDELLIIKGTCVFSVVSVVSIWVEGEFVYVKWDDCVADGNDSGDDGSQATAFGIDCSFEEFCPFAFASSNRFSSACSTVKQTKIW